MYSETTAQVLVTSITYNTVCVCVYIYPFKHIYLYVQIQYNNPQGVIAATSPVRRFRQSAYLFI